MRVKPSLWAFLGFLFLLGCTAPTNSNSGKGSIPSAHFPSNLSETTETLEVTYIAWACACANWLPTGYLADPNYSTTENAEDCIFIEAAEEAVRIPEDFHVGGNNNRIKLTGSFYTDKGISRDYVQPTSEIPEKARVFRYTSVEVVRPYTIWENNGEESLAKAIEDGTELYFEEGGK